MTKEGLKSIINEKRSLSKSESKELEKLAEKFGRKFDIIDIEKEFVYGYTDGKKEYLGTKDEYYEYRKLKSMNKKSLKKNPDKEKDANAYKCFLDSYKSNKF